MNKPQSIPPSSTIKPNCLRRLRNALIHRLLARRAERVVYDQASDFNALIGRICWYQGARWRIAGCAFADAHQYPPGVVLEGGRGGGLATARIDQVLLLA